MRKKNHLGYAGLTLAGFLLNFVCIGVCVGIIALVVKYLEGWLILYILSPLLVCAGIGAIHRLIRRVIRGRLHMKTTVYSFVSHGIPIIGGFAAVILALSVTMQSFNNLYCCLAGLAFFVEGMFGGLFAVSLDKLFNSSVDKPKKTEKGTKA